MVMQDEARPVFECGICIIPPVDTVAAERLLKTEDRCIYIVCDARMAFSLFAVLADCLDELAPTSHVREQLVIIVEALRHKLSAYPAYWISCTTRRRRELS